MAGINTSSNSQGTPYLYGIQRYDYVRYFERVYRAPIKQSVRYDATGFPTIECIEQAFEKIKYKLNRYIWLDNIYNGIQQIWDRKWESVTGIETVKVMCNEARQLTQDAANFFLGNPISYSVTEETEKKALEEVTNTFKRQHMTEHDLSMAILASRFGIANEYTYYDTKKDAQGIEIIEDGKPSSQLKTIAISPLNSAVVYHDEIENRKAYAMYFYEEQGKTIHGRKYKYKCTVYTDKIARQFTVSMEGKVINGKTVDKPDFEQETDDKPIYVGDVPISEVQNNNDRTSDWEHIVSLIDVKNDIMCDRANDIAMHIDAVLAILKSAGYNRDQLEELASGLKKYKILTLQDEEDGRFLSNPLDQAGIQSALDYIDKMIHKLTGIPDYTDQTLAAATGRALKLKLRPFISLANAKAANYKKLLMERLSFYARQIKLDKSLDLDTANIKIDFSYGIPTDDLETAQTVIPAVQSNIISKETASNRFSFVDSGKDEIEKIEKEKEKDKENGNNIDFFEPFQPSRMSQDEADNNADNS